MNVVATLGFSTRSATPFVVVFAPCVVFYPVVFLDTLGGGGTVQVALGAGGDLHFVLVDTGRKLCKAFDTNTLQSRWIRCSKVITWIRKHL